MGSDPKHAGHHAHLAHAAVVSLHVLCCGLPLAATMLGAVLGMVALNAPFLRIHHWIHGYEMYFLAASALLVGIGAYAEWRARAGRPKAQRRLPRLFFVSVACLFVNATIVAGHRLTHPATHTQAILVR